uniref:Gamma-aminobutyric acid type A receptor subunit epsilon n=1 Tax=Ovis aries TaxID=9940 RepID=A0AC11EGC1_SHEEP
MSTQSPCPTRWSASTRMARCCTPSVSYPENDLIYEWENFTLKINESNSWKLFQFDFTGVSNTTETVTTLAGDLNEEPRGLPGAALGAAFSHILTSQGSGGSALTVSSLRMEPVTQPAICHGRCLAWLPCG